VRLDGPFAVEIRMMRTNIKIFAGLLLLLAFAFLWGEKAIVSNALNQQFSQVAQQRATIVSRINLAINNNPVNERQGLSQLLTELGGINELAGWQLIDANNQIIQEKKAAVAHPSLAQHLYFYRDSAQSELITLKLIFHPPKVQSAWFNPANLLLWLGFVGCVLAGFFVTFKWIFQLEKYAIYLLTDTGNATKTNLQGISNPVSQVINQLLLRNSLLAKDKTELTQQIRKISYVDEVTELGNQLFFKAEFQVRLHNHEEDESGLFMLLSFVDEFVDDEAILNDDVLRRIANLIRTFAHEIPNALVARLRENDFALLLPNQSREKTDKICKTIISQLDKGIFDSTPIKEHFVDIGISAYKQGFDYYKIVAEADMALRNAQLQGGNNWFMYGEALAPNKVRGRIRWRSFLQRVLDKRKLQLYGQTVFFFDTDSERMQEVLARIEDGEDILTAETFLPMANSCGLASEFDRQVIDGVIKHCLYQEQSDKKSLFSINLFIASLLDDRFVGWLVGKLSSYPELSRQITFEIGESNINKNLSSLRLVMAQLAELGVSWCVEHFGSPNEDLSYLELLPISYVKIDRRIVFDIHKNKDQQLFLNSLLINLKSHNIKVIAEGVENEKEALYIRKVDLDGGQGFYFGQPLRMKRIEKYLKAV